MALSRTSLDWQQCEQKYSLLAVVLELFRVYVLILSDFATYPIYPSYSILNVFGRCLLVPRVIPIVWWSASSCEC